MVPTFQSWGASRWWARYRMSLCRHAASAPFAEAGVAAASARVASSVSTAAGAAAEAAAAAAPVVQTPAGKEVAKTSSLWRQQGRRCRSCRRIAEAVPGAGGWSSCRCRRSCSTAGMRRTMAGPATAAVGMQLERTRAARRSSAAPSLGLSARPGCCCRRRRTWSADLFRPVAAAVAATAAVAPAAASQEGSRCDQRRP
jgi:hypothetical protein